MGWYVIFIKTARVISLCLNFSKLWLLKNMEKIYLNLIRTRGGQSAFKNQKTNSDDETIDKMISILQQSYIAGNTFNLFYDRGCGDLVCKKSAIYKLTSIGRAKQEIPGTIVLSGVGDNKIVCKEGSYKINFALYGDKEAIMSGACLDIVTAEFPVSVVGRDINEHSVTFKGESASCQKMLGDKQT